MAEIRTNADSFTLVSRWRVVTGSNGVKEITEGPSTVTTTVTFSYKIPVGAKVKSAKVHSTWGDPLSGYAIRRVSGVTPDANGMVSIELNPEATSVDVVFTFKANGNTTATGDRSAAASVTDVYLLIEVSLSCIYHAENGVLVPYNFYHAENDALVQYQFFGIPGEPSTAMQLITAGGARLYTANGDCYKVQGG